MSKFLVSTFFSFLLVSTLAYGKESEPKAIKGSLDLSAWDFATNGPVNLDGEWRFYWKQLLTPNELESASPAAGYFDFPEIWNGHEINGHKLSGSGYATYSLTVILPRNRPALSLSMEDYFSSYAFFINGTLFSQNGRVASSPDAYLPSWEPVTKPLRSSADTLQLVLQIANFDHYKGGSSQSIIIGTEEELGLLRDQELAYDWVLAGAMFMGGLFFFGLYLFGRHDKAMLFFSLFCLVYSYRNIGSDLYAINTLVGGMPWGVGVRLEYVCIFLSLIFFTEYLLTLYPEEIHKPLFRLYNWINMTLLALTVVGPVKAFTTVLPWYLIILLAAIFYAAYVVFMAAINKREGAVYAVAAKMAVFTIVFYNILVYFGITPRLILFNFIAHLIFFFCQSLILSFRFASSLNRAKEAAEAASKAKTDFLSTISHEMRTPLNAVIGMTNFLLKDAPKPDQEENLHTLKFSAEHLMMLINDVLDYSKIEAGKIEFVPEPADLRELITQVIKSHQKKASGKGLDLKCSVAEEIPYKIVCDKLRVTQVLANLLDNAIKFTPSGYVELSLALAESEADRIKLRFEVIDTGIGIEPGKQQLIFESFSQANASTTREFGGSGLGLSITRKLLQLQGSEIGLESTPGKGSRFYFEQWFQIAPYQATEVEAPPPPSEKALPLRNKKVLVVEDNKINVLVVKKFLDKWGATVEIADNGLIALEKVRATNYDIILMDLQMPVMDGYEATVKIRETDKTPIIAITASVLMDVQDRIYKAGMNDYVTKPFIPDELLSKIVRYTKGRA